MRAIPVVGIDIGTTNTKVALVAIGTGTADVLAVNLARTPHPEALHGTLRRLFRRTLTDSPAPAAVGIASMAETGVPLDDRRRPLGSWVRWDRHSAAAEADELERRLGWAALVARTGVRPSGKVPLAAWSWLSANRPDDWTAMSSWAGVADLACLLLTGRLVTDHTLAGRTMAYRLPGADDALPTGFDAELLGEVGLRPDQLPDVARPDEVAGRATAAFADCGLPEGTPVVVAGHDHAVGAYGAGVREPGAVADSLGTAEAIISVVPTTPDPVAVARAGMSSVVTVSGTHRAILAGSSTAGAVVKWWLEHEARGMRADELFAAVLEASERHGDKPSDVLVLPYLAGRQTPAPDPRARLQILGRAAEHTTAELARAMFQGLALHARWMLEEQARLARTDPLASTVTVLGGAAVGIPAWSRMKASVLHCPVEVATAAEPVAAGAALVAAARAGLVDPPPHLLTQPEPAPSGAAADYDQPFARFVAAATEDQGDPS